MISYCNIDNLLDETAGLIDQLAQLEQTAGKVKQLSKTIVQTCHNLKPRHIKMAQDLERLGRLQEVIRTFILPSTSTTVSENADQAPIGFENPQPSSMRRYDAAVNPSSPDQMSSPVEHFITPKSL